MTSGRLPVLNLLTNARMALREVDRPDKCITLRVEPGSPGWLRIEVTDNGVGLSPEELPLLFSQGFTLRPLHEALLPG